MRLVFLALVGVLAAQRVLELAWNKRNLSRLLSQGGRLVEGDGFRFIVPVHVAWFLSLLAEHHWAPWAGTWSGTVPLLAVAGLAEALRLWTMATLGRRWTTRVVVVPGETLVQRGPYRWFSHPNYVAVSILLAAFPFAFGLWATGTLASLANLLALRHRVRVEEKALAEATGSLTRADA